MTEWQSNHEKLRIALSELEQALDWFDCDEAFVKFTTFEQDLLKTVEAVRFDLEHPKPRRVG